MNKQQLSEALAEIEGNRLRYDFEVSALIAAARLVERLLPEECDRALGKNCPFCFNTGLVWDEGIAATLEAALIPHVESPSLGAIAVLSALVELLTEKVEE